MMREDEVRAEVRAALDDCLSGVDAMPSRRGAILQKVKGEDKMKRKASFGVAVAMAVVLLAVGALAATLLTGRELVEQELIPLAQQNDGDTVNEDFSASELAYIVALAKDNGIELSDRLMTQLEAGKGYYEEETIMELARAAFGGLYYEWTIEQKYWYGEVMVAIGYTDQNLQCLPREGELTQPEAFQRAAQAIRDKTGDDVTETGRWQICVSYGYGVDENDALLPPQWFFDLERTVPEDRNYSVTISRTGEVLALTFSNGLDESSTAAEVMSFYSLAYGNQHSWDMATWVKARAALTGRKAESLEDWSYMNTTFLMPQPEQLTAAQAKELALAEVAEPHASAAHAVLALDGQTAVWTVEVAVNQADSVIQDTRIVEVDAATGNIRSSRVFDYPNENHAARYIPQSVIDSLPSMEQDGTADVLGDRTYERALENALAGRQPASLEADAQTSVSLRDALMALDFTKETAQERVTAWVAAYGDDMDFWPVDVKALMVAWADWESSDAEGLCVPAQGDVTQAQAEITARSAYREALGKAIPESFRMATWMRMDSAEGKQWHVRFVDTARSTGREAGEVLVDARTGEVVSTSAEEGGNG